MHPETSVPVTLAQDGDALATELVHDQFGQPCLFEPMIGKDPDEPGDVRLGQGWVRVRGVDHDDFGLEGDAQRDMGFGPVDRAQEPEHALVGKIHRKIAGAAPLGDALPLNQLEGELARLARAVRLFNRQDDALARADAAVPIGAVLGESSSPILSDFRSAGGG